MNQTTNFEMSCIYEEKSQAQGTWLIVEEGLNYAAISNSFALASVDSVIWLPPSRRANSDTR